MQGGELRHSAETTSIMPGRCGCCQEFFWLSVTFIKCYNCGKWLCRRCSTLPCSSPQPPVIITSFKPPPTTTTPPLYHAGSVGTSTPNPKSILIVTPPIVGQPSIKRPFNTALPQEVHTPEIQSSSPSSTPTSSYDPNSPLGMSVSAMFFNISSSSSQAALPPFCRTPPGVFCACIGSLTQGCSQASSSVCAGCGCCLCHSHTWPVTRSGLPEWLRRDTTSTPTSTLCEACHVIIQSPVPFLDAARIPVNELTLKGKFTTHILQCWSSIQYTLPGSQYCHLDEILLRNNKNIIRGHSIWVAHFLLCVPDISDADIAALIETTDFSNRVPCSALKCYKPCPKKGLFDIPEALLVLSTAGTCKPSVAKVALRCLALETRTLTLALPILVTCLKRDEAMCNAVWDFLYERAQRDLDFMAALFFALRSSSTGQPDCPYTPYFRYFRNFAASPSLAPAVRERCNIFKHALLNAGPQLISMRRGEQSYFDFPQDWYLPTASADSNPYTEMRKIKTFVSASAPSLYKCYNQASRVHNVIFKSENLCNDQIICNVIQYFKDILESNLECMRGNVVSYKVVPVSPDSGLIEVVDNADTLFKISTEMGKRLVDYIPAENRERFSYSVAAYTVISYLLGFGDRHEGNIMIENHRSFFHIDFGYILGHHASAEGFFGAPTIRFSDELMEIIELSIQKPKFLDTCFLVLRLLQPCLPFVAVMLKTVCVDQLNCISQNELYKFLYTRFMVGYDEQKQLQLLNAIVTEAVNSLGARLLKANHELSIKLSGWI
ncbi:phosphoinositide 3-kinase [Pelomyxa schiedti]|nr:phosphoinositide 3-kinase [Pelomyxa schiedti]